MEATPVVLEVPVPPVEPKIEAFESLIRQQEEEALRKRGLPISLARRGEKDWAKHLRDVEAAAQRREAILLQEIQSMRKQLQTLEGDKNALVADLARANAEKTCLEKGLGSELCILRAQLCKERDDCSVVMEELRTELAVAIACAQNCGTLIHLLASVARRKHIEFSLEDKEIELRTAKREFVALQSDVINIAEHEAKISVVKEKNKELMAELVELKSLRTTLRDLLAESENAILQKDARESEVKEEIKRARAVAEVEVAALRCTWDTERIQLSSEIAQANGVKQELENRVAAIEAKSTQREELRAAAEQRVVMLTARLQEALQHMLAEKRETQTAKEIKQTEVIVLRSQMAQEKNTLVEAKEALQAELVVLQMREKETEAWKSENALLATKLRFLEHQLAILEAANAQMSKVASLNSEMRSTHEAKQNEWKAERELYSTAMVAHEETIARLANEMYVSIAAHNEQCAQLQWRIAELENENQIAHVSSTEAAAVSAEREREIVSLRSEFSTTVELNKQLQEQLSIRLLELEDEKRSLQRRVEEADGDYEKNAADRNLQDKLTQLGEMLSMESRTRIHAEEEHHRLCGLYADAMASVQQAKGNTDAEEARIAKLQAAHETLAAELADVKDWREAEMSARDDQIKELVEEKDKLAAKLDEWEARVKRAEETSEADVGAARAQLRAVSEKLAAQSAQTDSEQNFRIATEIRLTEVQSALQAAKASDAHFASLKEAQLEALQQSRTELVERALWERIRADSAVEQVDQVKEELSKVNDERARLSGLVERLIAHTTTSAISISAAQDYLRSFDLAALEAMLCAARQSIQLPATALDANLLLRQLELKSEQQRLERLARKEAEGNVTLLRVQMEQLRTKEEESAAKLAAERLEVKRLANERALVDAARDTETAILEACRKRLSEAEKEAWRLRSEVQSQQAEIAPLRERVVTLAQRSAHLSEQAAAFDSQLSQSVELLAVASTPSKPKTPLRTPSLSSVILPTPSIEEESSELVSQSESVDELDRETADIIRSNPLVQSRRRLMRHSENNLPSPASPSFKRTVSAMSQSRSKPLSPANSTSSTPTKGAEKTCVKDKDRRSSLIDTTPTHKRATRTPTSKSSAAKASPRARVSSSFAAAPRAPFGKQ